MIDYVLLVAHTLLGLAQLTALPAFFHLLVFGRSRTLRDMLVSTLVANSVLLAVMVVLGLLGWFWLWTVGGVSLVVLLALVPVWRRLFRPGIAGASLVRTHLLLVGLFILFCLGGLVIRHYPYHSDTWSKYLGAGAQVAATGQIPSLDLAQLQVDYTNAPLMMLYNAFEFSLWGRNDLASRAIPVYFSTLTLFLLLAWGAEIRPKDQALPYLITATLILSQAFFRSFIGIIQEPPLLFFTTLSFYFFSRYITERRLVDYGLMVAACTAAILTKFSAPIPIVLVGLASLAWHPRQMGAKVAGGLLLAWPAVLWLGRNWVVWGNPLYPNLETVFHSHGRLHELTLLSSQIASVNIQAAWVSPAEFLADMALTFTFAPLAFWWMVRARRQPLPWLLTIGLVATWTFLFATGARWLERYFYPFIGLYALYAALGAVELGAIVSRRLRRAPPRWGWAVGVGLLMLTELGMLYVKHPVPYIAVPYERAVLGYLQAHTPAGATVTLLVDNSIVTWYDPTRTYRQWRFHDLPFLLATDGQFDLEGEAAYWHDELARIGVEYVYASPQPKTRSHFWNEVSAYPEYFRLVLENGGAQLWRVVPPQP